MKKYWEFTRSLAITKTKQKETSKQKKKVWEVGERKKKNVVRTNIY